MQIFNDSWPPRKKNNRLRAAGIDRIKRISLKRVPALIAFDMNPEVHTLLTSFILVKNVSIRANRIIPTLIAMKLSNVFQSCRYAMTRLGIELIRV